MSKKLNKIACISLAAILAVGATGLTTVLGVSMNDVQSINETSSKNTEVIFVDVNLKKALNQALVQLEDSTITVSQLQGLRNLDLSGKNIENLSGLENCVNLTALNIRNNKINNVNTIGSLINLKQLLLDDNNVEDISALANLDQLTKLTLNNNKIQNISVINELDNVKEIFATNNKISNLPVINKALTTLLLNNNCISDISPLSGVAINKINLSNQKVTGQSITSYDSVYAVDNIIKDVNNLGIAPTYSTGYDYDSLNDIIVLKSIFVSGGRKYFFDKQVIVGGQETNFSGEVRIEIERLGRDVIIEDQNLHTAINEYLGKDPLSQITNLELQNLRKLEIGDKNIQSLKGLEICDKLEELIAPYNDFSSLEPLRQLTGLKKLNIIASNVNDIEPIKDLNNLQLLYIDMRPNSETKMQNMDVISNFNDLRNISIAFSGATDIEFLRGLNSIAKVHIRDNNISDLSPLSNKINLQYLAAQRNKFSTIEPIANLENISELFLSGNRIEDIEKVSNFKNLTRLHLNDTEITNIENLVSLINLKELVISENNIVNMDNLSNMVSLEKLSISENPIKDADIRFVKNLNNLKSFYAEKNGIKDISPLANLTQLNVLSLSGNHITDISPLVNLNLSEGYLDNQTIILEEIKSNDNIAMANNILIKDINGNKIIMDKVSNNGIYNSNDNTVTWNDINSDVIATMEFSNLISLSNAKSGIMYSGIVQQPIKYINNNKNQIDIDKNPTTGTNGIVGLLGAMGLAGLATFITKKKKK